MNSILYDILIRGNSNNNAVFLKAFNNKRWLIATHGWFVTQGMERRLEELKIVRESYNSASENIKQAHENQKKYYDKKHGASKTVSETIKFPLQILLDFTIKLINVLSIDCDWSTYFPFIQSQEFSEGCEVLLRNSKYDLRKGGKLEARWLVPYKVMKCLGEECVHN